MSYQEMISYLDKAFNGDKIYLSLFRGWDFEMIMGNGEFNENDIVLDTGAMHSYFSVYLAQFVKEVRTTDNLSWAERDYFPKSGLPAPAEWMRVVMEKSSNVIAEKADVRNLPYGGNSFDKVLSISTIEHINDDKKAMSEMVRVLKPGGLLLITTEYNQEGKDYKEDTYLRIYNDASLLELLRPYNVAKRVIIPTEEKDYKTKGFTTIFLAVRK